jgi:spermidine/putrescine-binding protein
MKRIHLCLLVMTTLVVACAGPATTAAPAEAPTGPLVLLEWSGYELPEFWQPFADKYPDVTVDFSFFAEDAEAFAKLQTGFEADIVHPCSSWWKLYVDNGLVQPIDTSKLSNWPGIRAEFAKEGQFDGKQYFVPWEWGYESILVRTDKVSEIPGSWADLWDPQYAGHVALWSSGESNHAMAALALGFDPWNTTPEQDEQIKQKLIEIKPNLVTYWVDFTEVPLLISSGDAWVVANAWQDAYTTLIDEGIPVEYIEPKEGRLGWVCGYGISSKAKNVELAYEYINAAIAPQSMANMSNAYAYGAANAEALSLTDENYVKLMQLDQPDIIQRTVFFQSLTQEQRETFTSLWDEVLAAP